MRFCYFRTKRLQWELIVIASHTLSAAWLEIVLNSIFLGLQTIKASSNSQTNVQDFYFASLQKIFTQIFLKPIFVIEKFDSITRRWLISNNFITESIKYDGNGFFVILLCVRSHARRSG